MVQTRKLLGQPTLSISMCVYYTLIYTNKTDVKNLSAYESNIHILAASIALCVQLHTSNVVPPACSRGQLCTPQGPIENNSTANNAVAR